jgi:cation diffusion facilitator CzcD-associated flavoprotein CzcO
MSINVAIIGAGPAGLAAGRALKRQGIAFTIFERHHDVGGIWDIENPGSPVYKSAHFISSRTMSGFAGYPMPADYPDYPSNRQLLAYIRAFAHDMGLRPFIRFNTAVERAQRTDEGWLLHLADGGTQAFTHLVAAPGTNWAPNRVEIPGRLSGEVMHSVEYKSPEIFAGKRVLVVWAGNSGCHRRVHFAAARLPFHSQAHFRHADGCVRGARSAPAAVADAACVRPAAAHHHG